MKIPTSSPVMVTGSTGYVGGVLVQQLLEAGLTIHCPVRDPTNASKIQHLKDLKGGENLKFFEANLLEKGSYLDSMKDCSVVFHVASPFISKVPKGKEQEMLLDPAIKGTLNVLESARDPGSSVERVVVTSSIAAVSSDGTESGEVKERTGKMCNEESWNTFSSIDYNPYSYSKTLAEKAAWNFVKENDCPYDLVVCNPGFVMGPGVKINSGESYSLAINLGNGFLKSGAPDLSMIVVDVRDVAKGHIAAGFLPSERVAGQRYILNGANTNLLEVGKLLLEEYPNHPLPKLQVPKWIFWLVAPLLGRSRQFVSRSVGHVHQLDNSKSLRDLELGEYRPLKETLVDMFSQCIEQGQIPANY